MENKIVVAGKKSPKHARYTRLRVLLGLLVLLGIMAASRLHVAFSPCVFLRMGPLTLACPMGTLEVGLAGHAVIWSLVPGFIVLCVLLTFLGRMWCGWICPASLAGAAVGEISFFLLPGLTGLLQSRWKAAAEKISARFSPRKAHVLGFMAGLLIGAWIFHYPLWSIICPLGVVSRNLIQGSVHLVPRLDLIFLLFPVLAMLLWRNGWKCACPVGLTHGLLSLGNRTLLPVPERTGERHCNDCGLCRKLCPSGLNPAEHNIDSFACIKCLRCIEACPRRALRVRI